MAGYPLRVAMLLAFFTFTLLCTATATTKKQPNIVFILVDDQDLHLNSLSHMDVLQKELVQRGTFFEKHYGHVSQCCPSRTTIWTGHHAHNTNVTSVNNGWPGGAWTQVQAQGWYKNHVGVWMQKLGYSTYYSGKIFNGYSKQHFCSPCIEGWSKADIMLDPSTYSYYDSNFAHYDGDNWSINNKVQGYSTDQIGDNVANFIKQAAPSGPFMAVAAPVAPHVPSIPKKEYEHLYQDLKVPRTTNFNAANRTGIGFIWDLEQLNNTEVDALDEFYRRRQRCLKSVDDMLGTIIQSLTDAGVLDNTYIVYSTDNGYHIGNHRLMGGKDQCFEEDINIPLIIRGPDVGKNVTQTTFATGHVDLAPTFLSLAGFNSTGFLDLDYLGLDGTAIEFPLESPQDYTRNLENRGDSTHVEMWGEFKQELPVPGFHIASATSPHDVNIYKALRIQGQGYNLMYSVWCQRGAHELYDMSWDTQQMSNLHPEAPINGNGTNMYQSGMDALLGRPIWEVIHRLDALVLILKTCTGDSCRRPWEQLHPDGKVKNLSDALNPIHDKYYENSYKVAKVAWQHCYTGRYSTLFSTDNEVPLWLDQKTVHAVRSDSTRIGVQWQIFLLSWIAYFVIMSY